MLPVCILLVKWWMLPAGWAVTIFSGPGPLAGVRGSMSEWKPLLFLPDDPLHSPQQLTQTVPLLLMVDDNKLKTVLAYLK